MEAVCLMLGAPLDLGVHALGITLSGLLGSSAPLAFPQLPDKSQLTLA